MTTEEDWSRLRWISNDKLKKTGQLFQDALAMISSFKPGNSIIELLLLFNVLSSFDGLSCLLNSSGIFFPTHM